MAALSALHLLVDLHAAQCNYRITFAGHCASTIGFLEDKTTWHFSSYRIDCHRYTVQPLAILQSIASGLLGPAAYKGGVRTAVLGLLLHFFIACTASAIFYVAAKRLGFLRRYAVISGLLYGFAIYLVMNWIVLPLSAVPKPRPAVPAISLLNGVLAVVVLVGLPISLIVSRRIARE